MPLAHPVDVVSFSSEDPHHPASNLLNRETFRKWKCKEPGEKEAFVILKFEKAIQITCIDIGNDGSALVEVSVARSGGSGDPQFEVILSSSSFMGPLDSREGKNLNGVKSYSLHSLSKPIAAQKWDLVKVLVSQPFNRHVQYGLTFIKFMAAADPNEPKKIGIFGLRKPIGGDSDDDDDVKPGNLFSALGKSPQKGSNSSPKPIFKPATTPTTSSTNVAIKKATDELIAASKSSSEKEVKDLLQKPKINLPPVSVSTSSSPGRSSPLLLNRKQLEDKPIAKKDKDKDKGKAVKTGNTSNSPAAGSSKSTPKTASTSSNGTNKSSKKRPLSPTPQSKPQNNTSTSDVDPKPGSSSSTGSPQKKQKKAPRKTKPFNKLFEGVVFVLSGFENPLRGQLRDKAVQMGARYKADWDKSCTHLICAYYNTPKFRQVRSAGNGEIVKKDWIENSFTDRCRYPWRRFCVDRGDRGTESEEEIFAEEDANDEEQFEDEVDTLPNDVENNKEDEVKGNKRKRLMVMDSSDESDSNSKDSKNAYDAETDVDEDKDKDKTPDLSPSLMDTDSGILPIFENVVFYFSPDITKNDVSSLRSIITTRKGVVEKSLSDRVEYYICNDMKWSEDFADALSDNPNLAFVSQKWIVECDRENEIIDRDAFILCPD